MITNVLRLLADQPFRRLVWLAPVALAIHESEEWNILRWYHEHWNNVGDLSNRIVRTWLVFYSVLGLVVTFALLSPLGSHR